MYDDKDVDREFDALWEEGADAENQGGWGALIYEYVETFVFAAVMVVLLCTFALRIVRVDGESMVPTLQDGDMLVSSHAFYEPDHGDIVVITQPNEISTPLIKRVVGLPGDLLDIDFDEGVVYRNGVLLDEAYINEPTYYEPDHAMRFPLEVPQGMVFAMGDNRNHSSDSRDARIGLVDERYIMGRTFFRLFPFNEIGAVNT